MDSTEKRFNLLLNNALREIELSLRNDYERQKSNEKKLMDYYHAAAIDLQKSLKKSSYYLGSDYKLYKIKLPNEVIKGVKV